MMPKSRERSERVLGTHERSGRGAADGEAAVSTVLGAILVFGLLVLTLVVVQVRFVPVWDKQKEGDFSLQLGTQLNTLRSDLDRLVSNQTNGPFSDPLTLVRPGGFSFFSKGLLPATATFTPTTSTAGMTLTTAHTFSIQQSRGAALYGLGEDYASLVAGTPIGNVVGIEHLRLRVAAPVGSPGNPATLTLTVTDVNGKCAGQLVLEERNAASTDRNIQAQVLAPQQPPAAACNPTPINTHDELVKCLGALCANSPAYYYLDALDPALQFTAPLGVATYPITLTLTATGLTGAGSITYDTTTSSGTAHVGGTGQVLSSYNNFIGSGALTVRIPYQQLPQQTFATEYGAVFLEQPDGVAMLVAPTFSVSTGATQAALAWSFAALGGGSAAVNGARQAQVGLTASGGGTSLLATARDITFTISTAYPTVWAAYWDQQMQLAGLTSSTSFTPTGTCVATPNSPQYTITTTATSATLNFFGPCSGATDAAPDVFLNFREAAVAVDLAPAG
ncbi:MAG: hypothetical protein QOI63_1829 [Thermoplasmata archaeon]|jgi:hypothetical protein|nr:hypothetical protein [Thermoplasmata archaeon]